MISGDKQSERTLQQVISATPLEEEGQDNQIRKKEHTSDTVTKTQSTRGSRE